MSKHKAELTAAVITAIGGHPLCTCPGCSCVVDEAHANKFVEAIAPVIAKIAGEDAAAAAEHHTTVESEVIADLVETTA